VAAVLSTSSVVSPRVNCTLTACHTLIVPVSPKLAPGSGRTRSFKLTVTPRCLRSSPTVAARFETHARSDNRACCNTATAVVILVVLLFKPEGLYGTRRIERV